jgi:AraC family transcriptional regulator
MASTFNGARADVLTGIHSFVRGSSNRLISSSGLGWTGVSLEVHDASPTEKKEVISADHIIVLFTGHASRGEKSSQGRCVPYSYDPGAMNIYPAGPLPAARLFTSARLIVCALDPRFVRESSSDLDVPRPSELRCAQNFRDPSLQALIRLLAAEADSGGLSGRLYVDHLAHALALRFLRHREATGSQMYPRSENRPNRALQRVLDRMKAEFATDLDLRTLSAESGYGRTQFLRMFRTATGCSPHQWLTRFRMEQAKTMLKETSRSVIDIALTCGFSTHAHFANTFRKIVGATPSGYRRELR